MAQDVVPLRTTKIPLTFDSGFCANPTNATGPGPHLAFSQELALPQITGGVQLEFDEAQTVLAGTGRTASFLKITSTSSGHFQRLTPDGLRQWYYHTCGLQGPTFLVELYSFPGNAPSRVVITGALQTTPA
eukprot:TRINITY_DN4809_c0_g1_i1.p1 TRINITY_DN4809_c0_g1~~TRINITY_DN4809_c0_g1_i1.p1  ORF type:complete len:141 (-),score=21.22 TRINITY_DN4809_c0_g1_i1:25-417(-)